MTAAELAANEQNSFVIGPFGSDLVVGDYTAEGVPVVFVRDVKANSLRWKSQVFVSAEKAELLRAHRVVPGDVVITKMGLPAGVAAVYPETLPAGIVTADIIRLRPNRDVANARYVSEALNAPFASEQVTAITGGQTRPKLTLRDYKRIQILLPPLGEQRKIAAILSAVDDAVEATQAVIDQLQVVKKAMMAELLTRGLPGRHTRFKQTEIGEMPEEWKLVPMEDLSDPKGMVGGPFGSDLTAKDYVSEPGIAVIRGGNVSMGRFKEGGFVFVSCGKANDLAKNTARSGDIVMTQRGVSLGEATLLPDNGRYEVYVISQTMMRMTPDPSKISPRFLLHYTCSARAQQWLQGHQIATGQPHLNLGIYRQMPALVPERSEQEAIAATMDRLEEAQDAHALQLEQLKCVKSALMSVLLTGEVRVTPEEEAA